MPLIHINVPYSMLIDRVDFAIKNRINPEIYFSGSDLDTLKEKEAKQLAETLNNTMTIHALHGFKSRRWIEGQRGDSGSVLKDDELARLKPKTTLFTLAMRSLSSTQM
jgi:hypothetical protein